MHSNNGREYTNHDMPKYLSENDAQEFTYVDTSQQNGIAKRKK